MKADIANEVFESENDIELLTSFSEKEGFFLGEILLKSSPKASLLLDVEIPTSYPFSDGEISVRFITKGNIEAGHINLDGSICIHTPSHQNFESRLKLEISLLKEWRDKYYIGELKDDKYEYLITDYADQSCFLFTDVDHSFQKGDFGQFKYTLLADHSIPEKEIRATQYFVTEINGYKCCWSSRVHSYKSNTGFYTFIQQEPLKRPYRIVTNWQELEPYLSNGFLKKLYDYKSRSKESHRFPILIGYNISDKEGTEVHWQVINVTSNEIPIYGQKIGPKQYESACLDQTIQWSKCVNASYKRYFGRGALSPILASKKILVVGVGAIGSSLASNLVRAGIKSLDISDGDIVEPGNICRSDYYLMENQLPKTVAIARHLESISPFADTNIINKISKRIDDGQENQTKELLESYDIVIDCTSDNEISYFIDQLDIKSTVFNISITNEANEIALITGANITSQKREIFDKLNIADTKLIYEGTGCWSPTFAATHFDIQSLLNLLIQNINHQMESYGTVRTMVVKRELENRKINLRTIDY